MPIDRDKKTQILIWYYQTNTPNISKIAQDAGVDRKTVRNVVSKWEQFHTTAPTTSPGARRKLTNDDLAEFYAYVETPAGRSASLKLLKKKFRLPYTLARISQLLIKRGLRCQVHVKKPWLAPRHITARLAFANANKDRDWNQVVFSDEKIVQNFFNGKKLIRRRRSEQLNVEDHYLTVPNRNLKVNLWGFIAVDCWGIFLLPEKKKGRLINPSNPGEVQSKGFNSVDYLKILETGFLPMIREKKDNFVFMQDGAPIHNPAKAFLRQQNIEFLDWPAKSPDLNIIENVWGGMQKIVNKWFLTRSYPKNRNQLFTLCKAAFNIVCKKNSKALFDSIPRRMQSVIDNGGKSTKY